MRPKSVRKYSISSVAKRALKGRPIKIGGGDGGILTRDILHHRKFRYELASDIELQPLNVEEK